MLASCYVSQHFVFEQTVYVMENVYVLTGHLGAQPTFGALVDKASTSLSSVMLCRCCCRNALRKHYFTLRENLHIAVKDAEASVDVLVRRDMPLQTHARVHAK